MPKLRLKRTREEEEEYERKRERKARRRERKAKRRHQQKEEEEKKDHDYLFSFSSDNAGSSAAGPGPSTSQYRSNKNTSYRAAYTEDYNPELDPHGEDEAASTLRDRLEQERFEEKMRDALEDDHQYDPSQRLDGVEARLNSYAHVPRRWRGTGQDFSAGLWMEEAQQEIGVETWQMNDDEYAEYIRAGMWRKKNEAEYQERLRKKLEREKREERERVARNERKRLEKELRIEQDIQNASRAKRRIEEARRLYDERWAELLDQHRGNGSSNPDPDSKGKNKERDKERVHLHFDDIPWPIYPPSSSKSKRHMVARIEGFTKDAIESFLSPPRNDYDCDAVREVGEFVSGTSDGKRRRNVDDGVELREAVRRTMLRFHPDKFESRILVRVREKDREMVKEAADIVIRVLNELSQSLRT